MSTPTGIPRTAKGKKRTALPRTISRKHPGAGAKIKGGTVPNVPVEFGEEHYRRPRQKPARLEVKAEDGKLVITLPRFDPPTRSGSGKSFVVATTGGVKRSSFTVDGFPVHVVASAFFYDNGGQPPVRFVPLLDLPKQDDDEDDDGAGYGELEELS